MTLSQIHVVTKRLQKAPWHKRHRPFPTQGYTCAACSLLIFRRVLEYAMLDGPITFATCSFTVSNASCIPLHTDLECGKHCPQAAADFTHNLCTNRTGPLTARQPADRESNALLQFREQNQQHMTWSEQQLRCHLLHNTCDHAQPITA